MQSETLLPHDKVSLNFKKRDTALQDVICRLASPATVVGLYKVAVSSCSHTYMCTSNKVKDCNVMTIY